MNIRGNLSFVFIFAIIAITVLFLFVFISPALQSFTTKIYAAGEPLLEDANATANSWDDAAIKSSVQGAFQESKDSTATQVEVLNLLFTYAWVFVLVISAIILMLFSRFLVERGVGAV